MGLETLNLHLRLDVHKNGIDALTKLKTDKATLPDLIFVDMNMPMMNGKDCVKQIRKITGFSKVPIVMYSSYDKTYGNSEAVKCGADLFFTKPAFISDWAGSLKTVFNRFVEVSK